MPKITITDDQIIHKKLIKTSILPFADLVWAYIQQEDVKTSVCCGPVHMEIGRVIAYTKDGRKTVFSFESVKEAEKLLDEIRKAAPHAAIGFTEENKKIFSKFM